MLGIIVIQHHDYMHGRTYKGKIMLGIIVIQHHDYMHGRTYKGKMTDAQCEELLFKLLEQL